MSDYEDQPEHLFDAICRLDDLAEWIEEAGYADEATQLRATSLELKGYIVISMKTEADGDPAA